MNLTPEQIEKYSKLMAEFEGWELCQCGTPKEPHYKWGTKNWEVVSVKDLKYHTDWNWLHRVWEKFRDLKFEDSDDPSDPLIIHRTYCNDIVFEICYGVLEEALIELGKAIEWYQTIKK